ncbi:arf-GAP with coiled-coil, ANK repeat and PH domain-containing protein 2-like [Clytia hemisphaerica]|uniref:Uncharacterized protein n=1 Tax=Clytia hemisphaerica TaxID=252671 RepID=A0A7M5X6I8_9CNID|eukprot:TCONS_00027012-protein
MVPLLDFHECLKDSPKFRADLEDRENTLHNLEHHLEKLVKISNHVVESGKVFGQNIGSLVASFDSMSAQFPSDPFVSKSLIKINTVLGDLQSFLMVFLEQTQKSITNSMHHFVKDDIKKVKESKKYFDKISDDLDSALVKNSQLLKNCKRSDAEEAENVLIATKSGFHHTALDYCFLLNSLESKKRFHILSQIVMFINGFYMYHKQGHEVLLNFEDYRTDISRQLELLHSDFLVDQKEMEERHSLVIQKNNEFENILNQSLPRSRNLVIMEGYLFKRASNTFKSWNKRWFVIQNNKLYYTHRSAKKEGITEMVDLRLSTVKNAVDVDRRFTFSVVCPTKCWYLQADNEKTKDHWMNVMQMAIARALNDPETNDDLPDDSFEKLHPQYLLTQIRELPGNNECADCGESNPKWASINLGIAFCIVCSGIHRSLGVHISKVRSITLDDWDTESINLMLELGNEVINGVYEASIPNGWQKPTPQSPRKDREDWIKAKYVDKKFVYRMPNTSSSTASKSSKLARRDVLKRGTDGVLRKYSSDRVDVIDMETISGRAEKHGSVSSVDSIDSDDENDNCLGPDASLFESAKSKNLSMMVMAFSNGADVNWVNEKADNKTALHQSVITGSVSASEYLLQNGAQVNAQDNFGRSALHYAAMHGSTGHTCLFLKRDADQKLKDKENQDALTIALQNTHADIVTLIRLARLHEEIKETDITMGGDETVTEVFKDFSNRAVKHERQTYI